MQTRVLIKRLGADESSRRRWNLDGGLRLDPRSNTIKIPTSHGAYSLDETLTAESSVSRPLAVKRWLAFSASVKHKKSPDGGAAFVTSARFKLGDGVSWYWWNGTQWIANDPQWNTETQISQGIESFPVTQTAVQVRVNLRTTDQRVGPELVEIKFAYSAVIESIDDVVLRSLRRTLATQTVIGRVDMISPTDGATSFVVSLKNHYVVTGIDSVFDETEDPEHLSDLYQSWNGATNTVTTSALIPAGHVVRINFKHTAEVALHTDVDYREMKVIPAIGFTSTQEIDQGYTSSDYVINLATNRGYRLARARQFDLVITLELAASKLWDLMRLAEMVKMTCGDHAKVTSLGTDESFDLAIHEPFIVRNTSGTRNVHVGTMSLTVKRVLSFEAGHTLVTGLDSFKVTPGTSENQAGAEHYLNLTK
jgi:hypothetical protein